MDGQDGAIITRGLSKRFGDLTALDAVDLNVEYRSIFGVIGPNGAGKTTLMRILLDLLRPSAGSARVLDLDPRRSGPQLRTQIGYLPGEIHLAANRSGADQLRLWAGLSGNAHAFDYARGLAQELEIDLERKVGKLSKGNKQKIGIIQALMHRPRLLLLDEPTSGLDPIVQQRFLKLIQQAHADGATVFLSSHILSEIEQVAERAVVLRGGKIVKEGTISELRQSAKRLLKVRVRGVEASRVQRELAAFAERIETGSDGDVTWARALVAGNIGAVIEFCGRHRVEDFVFAEPSLEESVLDMYSRGERV